MIDETIEEELTAYLDGELDPSERRRVEERLARDPEFRGELQRLERAWDLLDRLPRATVGDGFTRSTIEMVAIAAEDEARTQALAIPRRRRRTVYVGMAAAAAASFLGFILGVSIWRSPNDALVRDLPVIQNFDRYRYADSLEFVRSLASSGLFSGDDFDAVTPSIAPANPAARARLVRSMPQDEQQELLRNQERLTELPTAEQERRRRLHAEISQAADSAQLFDVLERYHEWLKTLSPEQRASFVELPASERIARIRKLMDRQKETRNRQRPRGNDGEPPLDDADQKAMIRWFEQFVTTNRELLLKGLPADRRKKIEKMPERQQRRALVWAAVQHWRREQPMIGPTDIDRLAEQLSAMPRTRLVQADPHEQRQLVREWLQEAIATRIDSFGPRRGLAVVSEDELQRFFQEDLPNRERERLLAMPTGEMQQELRQLYLRHAGPPDGPPGPRDGGFGPPHRRDMGPPDFRGPRDGRPRGRPPGGQPGGPHNDRPPGERPPKPRDEKPSDRLPPDSQPSEKKPPDKPT